jgi:hypothetical protein
MQDELQNASPIRHIRHYRSAKLSRTCGWSARPAEFCNGLSLAADETRDTLTGA